MEAAQRRYKPTNAPRPDLGAVLAKADRQLESGMALITSLQRQRSAAPPGVRGPAVIGQHSGGLPVDYPYLVQRVAARIDAISRPVAADDAVAVAIIEEIRALVTDTMQRSWAYLRAIKPSLSETATYTGSVAEHLRHAGFPERTVNGDDTSPFGRETRRVLRAADVLASIADGSLESALDNTPAESAPATAGAWLATHAAGEFAEQAEGLMWALITLESQRHVGLVKTVANRMQLSYEAFTAEDLFSWGWWGLCLALRSYDPRTAAFSTYAVTRINGAIRDGIRSESHLPKRLTAFVRNVEHAEDTIRQTLQREPALEELSALVGATLAELEAIQRYRAPRSLDEALANDNDGWVPVDPASPETEAMSSILNEDIGGALGKLPTEERYVVQALVMEQRSLVEVAAETGMSVRQVRRVRDLAFSRLRDQLASWNDA